MTWCCALSSPVAFFGGGREQGGSARRRGRRAFCFLNSSTGHRGCGGSPFGANIRPKRWPGRGLRGVQRLFSEAGFDVWEPDYRWVRTDRPWVKDGRRRIEVVHCSTELPRWWGATWRAKVGQKAAIGVAFFDGDAAPNSTMPRSDSLDNRSQNRSNCPPPFPGGLTTIWNGNGLWTVNVQRVVVRGR